MLNDDWGEIVPPSLAGSRALVTVDNKRDTEMVVVTSNNIEVVTLNSSNTTNPLVTTTTSHLASTNPTTPRVVKQSSIKHYLEQPLANTCTSLAQDIPPPTPCGSRIPIEDITFEDNTVMQPSQDPLIQDDGDSVLPTPASNGDHNDGYKTTKTSKEPPSVTSNENCTFKRGGMCVVHNRLGTKDWKTTTSWKKKKDGSFGWVYGKKVIYRCEFSSKKKPGRTMDSVLKNSESDGAGNNGKKQLLSKGLSNLFNQKSESNIALEESESYSPD